MCRTKSPPRSPGTSERAFLTNRAADAKKAMGRTLCEMKENLTTMAGVRSCAARHPWLLTGSAVAVGVVAGVLLAPAARHRHRGTAASRLDSTPEAPPARCEPEPRRATKSLLFSLTGTVLAAVLQPLLQSWFAPAATVPDEARSAPPTPRDPVQSAAPE